MSTLLAVYVVLSVLSHNNETFNAGDRLELDEKTAAPLLAVGCIEPAEETGEEEKKPATAAEVIALIEAADSVEAVKTLIEGDERKGVNAAAEKRIKELQPA